MSKNLTKLDGECLRTLGRAFVLYCRNYAEAADCEGFSSFLNSQGLSAVVSIIYRREAGDEVYYSEQLQSPAIYWHVQLGEWNCLLPRPVSAEQFDDFNGIIRCKSLPSETPKPKWLGQCTPALLAPSRDHWVVEEYGQLSNGDPPQLPEHSPGVREVIGLCFVEFCRGDRGVYEADEFEAELCKVVSGTKVMVGYRTSSAQEAYFHPERPKTSSSKGWVVTSGAHLFLLPWAMSPSEFDTVIDCFKMTQGTMPKNLKDCLPATLLLEGKRWGVIDMGRLSAQPEEKLQRWWEAHQKPKPANPSTVVNLPAGETSGAGQAQDAPIAATVGEEFVKFCKQALIGYEPPKFEDFLEALKRRFPAAGLTGDGDVKEKKETATTLWLIYQGEKERATNGWILPAIKSLNEFHPFGTAFYKEGMPTPETVEHVLSGELALMEVGDTKEWTLVIGRLSAMKSGDPSYGIVEKGQLDVSLKPRSLRDSIGVSFVRFCRINHGPRLAESANFETFLKPELPQAQVMAICHDPSDWRGIVFAEFLRGGPGAWLVLCGEEAFLVPAPTDEGGFEKLEGFQCEGNVSSRTLNVVIPAVMSRNRLCWTVMEPGAMNCARSEEFPNNVAASAISQGSVGKAPTPQAGIILAKATDSEALKGRGVLPDDKSAAATIGSFTKAAKPSRKQKSRKEERKGMSAATDQRKPPHVLESSTRVPASRDPLASLPGTEVVGGSSAVLESWQTARSPFVATSGSLDPKPEKTRELVGLCFATFCRELKWFSPGEFLERLNRTIPSASLIDCWRLPSTQGEYYVDADHNGASQYLRVCVGSENYLLPRPLIRTRFADVEGFELPQHGTITPLELKSCHPAKLAKNGHHWEVAERGFLSDQTRVEIKSEANEAPLSSIAAVVPERKPLVLRSVQENSGELLSPTRESIPIPDRGRKVARNDPCPCGSGEKYKRCCGIL